MELTMFDLNYVAQKKIFEKVPLPFCFLDLNRLDMNIDLIRMRAKNKKIRLATKSIRSREVLKYLSHKLGEKFSGLMTYRVEESIDLLNDGFDHCLLAYPQKISIDQAMAIRELGSKNKILVLMVDSVEHILFLEKLGREIHFCFEICLDIDLSLQLPGLNFGVYRSPLRGVQDLNSLLEIIENSTNVKLSAFMGYEAQIAGIPDRSKKGRLFNFLVSKLKSISKRNVLSKRKIFLEKISPEASIQIVNGGGSGSLSFSSDDESITEVTVGSGFYGPHLFDAYEDSFLPSCGFAIEVSRSPNPQYITCLGGGYVASGSLDQNKFPLVFSPRGLVPNKNEMFGEVQTPFLNQSHENIEIGDPIFLRHSKAGELLEHFNELLILRDHKIIDRWKTYRGEGRCYL
jgi:D-serine deaminase-like pyridoxal phosphate-dependent protein